MLNKLKLTRQGSLLYIQSSKYTLGIALPRKVVSHARLTWTFVTPQSGEESMFLKPLAEFHEPGYGPLLKYSLPKGKSGGSFLCPFRPSPWPHLWNP